MKNPDEILSVLGGQYSPAYPDKSADRFVKFKSYEKIYVILVFLQKQKSIEKKLFY